MRINLIIFLVTMSSFVDAQDFSIYTYRDLGPYRGGRVTAVSGVAGEPSHFYFGATGGGMWKSTDFGTTWQNISDEFFRSPSIGAIAVASNDPNIVYVGTGSDGLRSNVIAGDGIYKSIDAGKTWKHIGLKKSGHIGAVAIDPQNHNTVYVAAIGNAFAANEERGIYKSSDGGRTWNKVLYLSETSGFSDVELMPSNPDIVYAAAWKAERKPWTIVSGGSQEEGGIYRSVDGGQSWEHITKGLPDGLIGKIDLAVTPADSRVVYALVEAPGKKGGLYKSIDQGESFDHVSSHNGIRTRPFYYTNIEVDPTDADVVYAMATGYYKSTDGGESWKRISSPHGDNHDMWINPDNPELFIQANDGGANVTHNGGATWSTQFNQPTAEIYQVEVDDQYPYWLYGGQQDNYSAVAVPSMAPYGVQYPGIGYIVNAGGCETGPAVPKPGNADVVYANCKGRFTVYDKRTGTEKSYYVGASNMYGHNPKDLEYRFQRVAPIHVSPHDGATIYHCSQFVHRSRDEGKTWETISPDLTAFDGDKQVISGAPITRDITGEEFYSTIYSIRESIVRPGVIWVGANDGPVHVTKDGGKTWLDVTPAGLPPGGRVDAVEPSPHDPSKAYITVLRYQLGDSKPYIYRTTDYGQSWTLLTTGNNGIPVDHPCRVVREDPVIEGMLMAGTEYGVYVSIDDGNNWHPFQQNLPVTPITDLKIYRGDVVVSTMGRGFWVLDNYISLRESMGAMPEVVTLYKPKNTFRYDYPSGARASTMPEYPRPAVEVDYYLPSECPDGLALRVLDSDGSVLVTFASDTNAVSTTETVEEDMSLNTVEYIVDQRLVNKPGLHRFRWDMTVAGPWNKDANRRYKSGPRALPGYYTLELQAGDHVEQTLLVLRQDPRTLDLLNRNELQEQYELLIMTRDLLSTARRMIEETEAVIADKQISEEIRKRHKEVLKQLKTASGTYQQPMLADQISYLYNMINDTYQTPGKEALDRYSSLAAMLDALREQREEAGETAIKD